MTPNRELMQQIACFPTGSIETNDLLYPAVTKGDQVAVKSMIESNIPLVVSKVKSYIEQFPHVSHLYDDLMSAGFLGLVEAVNRMSSDRAVDNPHPTSYIGCWVQRRIGEIADDQGDVIASHRTQRRARKDDRELPKHEPLGECNLDIHVDPRSMIELRDQIDACCETDEDRAIMDLREKGYSDREISQQLNLPYTTTYMMRREVYSRFLSMTGMKGEV